MKEHDKYNPKYFKKINENEYRQIKYDFCKKQPQINFFIPNSIIYNEIIKMLYN